ncbi:MAG: hypothetical protein ABI867_09740 [Kofleriaceae bacterium]
MRLALAIVLVVLAASHARADIPVVFQSGPHTFVSGPMPAPFDSEPVLGGARAGYVCDVIGVGWSYVSIDNCRPAAVLNDAYNDSAVIGAAVKARYGEPTFTFWALHGWKLIAGSLALVVAAWVLRRWRRRAAYGEDVPTARVAAPAFIFVAPPAPPPLFIHTPQWTPPPPARLPAATPPAQPHLRQPEPEHRDPDKTQLGWVPPKRY